MAELPHHQDIGDDDHDHDHDIDDHEFIDDHGDIDHDGHHVDLDTPGEGYEDLHLEAIFLKTQMSQLSSVKEMMILIIAF